MIERHQDAAGHVNANPVGTSPYQLTQWLRGSRIVLDASPTYRGFTWSFQAGNDPDDQHIVTQMAGKRKPQIDRIDIKVIEEDQSRWLSFINDKIDLFQLLGPLAPLALSEGKLRFDLAKTGVHLSRIADPELNFVYWNIHDPVVGGLSKEKIALRRAIAMAYDVHEEIRQVWNHEAIAVEYPIPPGVVGHDANYRNIFQPEPRAANALLDKFSYKKGQDGWRMLPDGRPLQVKYSAPSNSLGRLQAELWKKAFNLIGIQMIADLRPSSELLLETKQCKLQMRPASWSADYPRWR